MGLSLGGIASFLGNAISASGAPEPGAAGKSQQKAAQKLTNTFYPAKATPTPKSNTVGGAATPVSKSNTISGGSSSTGTGGSASTGYNGTGQSLTSILNQIASKQAQATESGQSQFGTALQDYQTGAGTLLNTAQQGQSNINQELDTAEQNKQQSITSLLNQLKQNSQSDAVKLSSANALGSSAADALARGEVNYGNEQRGTIGAQEQAALNQANSDQSNLNTQVQTQLASLHQQRDNAVTQIGNQVADALNQLDYYANGLGLSGKVQVDGLKNQVVNQGLSQLQSVDSWLSGQLANNQPISQQQAAANAYSNIQAGQTNAGNPFTYSDPNNAATTTPAPATTQATDTSGNAVAGAPTAVLPTVKKTDPNAPVTA